MADLVINRLVEGTMVAGSGALLVGTVVAFDDGIRGHFTGLVSGGFAGEMTVAGELIQRSVRVATDAVGFQGSFDSPMVLFAIAALVLLGFMLKL
jgi:hypothetical protein